MLTAESSEAHHCTGGEGQSTGSLAGLEHDEAL
jgi:hypothetical protein